MKKVLGFLASVVLILSTSASAFFNPPKRDDASNNISEIVVKDINGKEVSLSIYKGKVLMIVNVASKCGNTPQYEGLEKIYHKYKDKGFEILAFPCNDFGGQEPGTNEEIKDFCSINYNVTFQLFDKVKVLGVEKSLLFARLTNNSVTQVGDVKWNFEKFIIDKNGNIIARFGNKIQPESKEVIKVLEMELEK